MIAIPELNPKFYYGPVVSHEFRDVSKDKGKYRVRIYITFQNGFQTSFQKGDLLLKGKRIERILKLLTTLSRDLLVHFNLQFKK